MRNVQRLLPIIALVAVCVSFALAQEPRVTNARVQELSAGGGLKATVAGLQQKQADPFWIGYRIPVVARERAMCCFNSYGRSGDNDLGCGGCTMESGEDGSFSGASSSCRPPEPLNYAFLFLRPAGGKIGKVRVLQPGLPAGFRQPSSLLD